MKFGILCIIIFCSCASKYKIGGTYNLGLDKLSFNPVNKRFVYVDRLELSFSDYAEGVYFQDRKIIYLRPDSFDSCIVYKRLNDGMPGKFAIHCDNYDPRFNIRYSINKRQYECLKDGSLVLEHLDDDSLEIGINVPFPEFNGSTCYVKRKALYKKIKMPGRNFANEGVSVHYRINYNYFNWVPVVDTFMIGNKKNIRSKAGYKYRKIKGEGDELHINYLFQCMIPYMPK